MPFPTHGACGNQQASTRPAQLGWTRRGAVLGRYTRYQDSHCCRADGHTPVPSTTLLWQRSIGREPYVGLVHQNASWDYLSAREIYLCRIQNKPTYTIIPCLRHIETLSCCVLHLKQHGSNNVTAWWQITGRRENWKGIEWKGQVDWDLCLSDGATGKTYCGSACCWQRKQHIEICFPVGTLPHCYKFDTEKQPLWGKCIAWLWPDHAQS